MTAFDKKKRLAFARGRGDAHPTAFVAGAKRIGEGGREACVVRSPTGSVFGESFDFSTNALSKGKKKRLGESSLPTEMLKKKGISASFESRFFREMRGAVAKGRYRPPGQQRENQKVSHI